MSNKVFISWSGELSRKVAEMLKEQIQDILPDVEPFFSGDGIGKGLVWHHKLIEALTEASFGVLVLTKENIASPWLLFEAGIIFKGFSANPVCPLLVDLSIKDVRRTESPLLVFNCADLQDKKEILKLIRDINSRGEKIRPKEWIEEWIDKKFENWWRDFENKLSSVLNDYRLEQAKRDKKARDVIGEQLDSHKLSKEEIVEVFQLASLTEVQNISHKIEERRLDYVYALPVVKDDKIKYNEYKHKLSYFIPLLEALIEIESKESENLKLPELYARLAYVYKDKSQPEWEKTLDFINKAINERERLKLTRSDWVDYELNRMVCNININLGKHEGFNNIEKDFEWVWSVKGSEGGKYRLMTIAPVWAPNLREWMIEHKLENVVKGLKQYPYKKDDWLNSVQKELADKLRERLN